MQGMISVEVVINKKEMAALSTMQKEDIEAIATAIEEGTYEKAKPEKPPTAGTEEPADPLSAILAALRPLDEIIRKIAGGTTPEPQDLFDNGDKTEIKTAIRAYINVLEELYKGILRR